MVFILCHCPMRRAAGERTGFLLPFGARWSFLTHPASSPSPCPLFPTPPPRRTVHRAFLQEASQGASSGKAVREPPQWPWSWSQSLRVPSCVCLLEGPGPGPAGPEPAGGCPGMRYNSSTRKAGEYLHWLFC